MTGSINLHFSFFQALRSFYDNNRSKIRKNYKDLTRKYLDYNDKSVNFNAFLRKPQFEALEMYVFIKEFMNNEQMYTIFDDWRNKRNCFSGASYYSINPGQISFYDLNAEQSRDIFNQMRKYSENYSNYIYALTMGLGKTILMATCIFYEFLLANKYPKDTRFCHNALVFAPDKTVLQSLREIITFDKGLVVPEEYARVLDTNIKFHFLEETGTTLNTLDDSDFNIIISNTQKIILKKKHVDLKPTDKLFKMESKAAESPIGEVLDEIYGDDEASDDTELIFNQRFEKLLRLTQLGVYVDEAHHMFGSNLEKELHKNNSTTSLRNTINELASRLEKKGTSVVACYNYTGTPYIKNTILPEVVYAYSLSDSIANNYLKEADVKGFEKVKNEEFLRIVISDFWNTYGENTYEGLLPKLAIFSSRIDEIETEVRPTVEKILSELGISQSKILVNVGDSALTKNDAIRDFNNLDVIGTEGSMKQFVLLCDKGREGWNCRSLFSVALFRSPDSKVFILQATMRCLRKITDIQQRAKVYLSKDNFDILDTELKQNFRMNISDLKKTNTITKNIYKVKPEPPPRYINMNFVKHNYSLIELNYSAPITFGLKDFDYEKYEAKVYEKHGLTKGLTVKEKNIDDLRDSTQYSLLTLVFEISRYLNISCMKIMKIVSESIDGTKLIVDKCSRYNDIIYDVVIPQIFKTLFEVKCDVESFKKNVILLKEPVNAGYYEFSADPELVVSNDDLKVNNYINKSFHANIYCFDSKPEKECFFQYLFSDKVKEVFFTGMFTSSQSDFAIQYIDPETNKLRKYYPDFLALMNDDTYRIIEVKGDNSIDDTVVKAKADSAREIAVESSMEYKIYPSSKIMRSNILSDDFENNSNSLVSL